MKRLVLSLSLVALFCTTLFAAGVSYIKSQGDEGFSKKFYTVGCTDGSYGTASNEKGMVCASGNGKSAKCSYNWGLNSAASYICR